MTKREQRNTVRNYSVLYTKVEEVYRAIDAEQQKLLEILLLIREVRGEIIKDMNNGQEGTQAKEKN